MRISIVSVGIPSGRSTVVKVSKISIWPMKALPIVGFVNDGANDLAWLDAMLIAYDIGWALVDTGQDARYGKMPTMPV